MLNYDEKGYLYANTRRHLQTTFWDVYQTTATFKYFNNSTEPTNLSGKSQIDFEIAITKIAKLQSLGSNIINIILLKAL